MKQKSSRQTLAHQKITVSFWGVRGSIASPRLKNSRYGGETACVAIHYKKNWLVCDAGTGIRNLGQKLRKTKEPITLFLSHLHWDHLFGLPFFKPLYQRGRKILLAGPANQYSSFRKALGQIVAPPFFPIRPRDWKAAIQWRTLKSGAALLEAMKVEARRAKHPGETYGFKFIFPGGKKIIYVTDQELQSSDKPFAKWIKGADLLIHDSQYDRKKQAAKKGWGHSAFETVLEIALKAGVQRLVLFHHDPDSDDRLLEKRLKGCKKTIRTHKSSMKCFLAKEGSSFLV